jgi:hypothetical protein
MPYPPRATATNANSEQQEGDEYRRTYGRDADHSRGIATAQNAPSPDEMTCGPCGQTFTVEGFFDHACPKEKRDV